ncbi:MAG: DUF1634 domain-containing protein [Chloroflexi bacterium]|nr:DUF1634 domain-containing protein [Chloroflexota bacterium]
MRTVEARLAAVLGVGSRIAVAILAVGIALMVGRGLSPLDVPPALAVERLLRDLVTLHPAGYLWLGAIALMSLPIVRLVVAIWAFWTAGERPRAGIGVATLVVIAAGIVLGLAGGA